MGSFSIWHWLVVLAIVLIIFGAKKLRGVGSDLGAAIRNFKQAMNEDDKGKPESEPADDNKKISSSAGRIIDAEVADKEKKTPRA